MAGSRLLSPIIVADQKELRDLVVEAEGYKDDAETAQGIATTQAGTATTQAGIATTQAGIATTQAGIATTKAAEAAVSAGAAAAIALDDFVQVLPNSQMVVDAAGLPTTARMLGQSPNQAPLNANLGGMAFQSPESVVIKPQATAVPNGVGDMTFQATSDSVIELEYKGSDAVVRTAQIPLSNERLAMLSRVTPLRQAVRVAMTAAASGSNGIQVLDNANADFGTSNFTLHWEGSLPDWTPSATQSLILKFGSSLGYGLQVLSAGTVQLLFGGGSTETYVSTVATGLANGAFAKISIAVVRETASVAGSVTFYVNGVQLGASVAIGARATPNSDNALSLYIAGSNAVRTASDTTNAIIYNRALSAAEVLSLCVNGPALADIGASQAATLTSDFSAGTNSFTGNAGTVTGNIDTIGGEDNWLRLVVDATNSSHFARRSTTLITANTRFRISYKYFLPSGQSHVDGVGLLINNGATLVGAVNTITDTTTTVTAEVLIGSADSDLRFYAYDGASTVFQDASGDDLFYIKDAVVTKLGITGQWSAEDAQSNTGQIFDRSGNGNHALLPAAGATIIGRPTAQSQQVRWTNTWAETHELQYIGGVNQAILPARAYIESIVGVITTTGGSGVQDVIIGDGSDTDRYVTITTGLAAGTTTFTLANRTTDGTNLKLTVDPDANATMSIAWTITYRTLE